ncbi:Hypothetical protein CINCED_3A002045 [Cinara cedri]|uniref:Uncharacterized protein n=1 Tax=Cinara cedri TaxID=506608 RepID=A0A5E4NCF4_9HEMI|nr:Hypothetical protein CINCED_3A002045 [Cinara cedri]
MAYLRIFLSQKTARIAVWIENCKFNMIIIKTINKLDINIKYSVCSLHSEINMFSNFQNSRLKAEAVPKLFDAMEVECVDESKNNDSSKCRNSDFMPLLCLTPGSSARLSINSQRISDASTSMDIETKYYGSTQTSSYLSSKTPKSSSSGKP